MQQIIFKREFSFLFDAVKTENVQYLEGKKQPNKRDCCRKKSRKKNHLKFEFLGIQIDFRKNLFIPHLGYVHTKFGINRSSLLDAILYTDRFTNKLFVLLLLQIVFFF